MGTAKNLKKQRKEIRKAFKGNFPLFLKYCYNLKLYDRLYMAAHIIFKLNKKDLDKYQKIKVKQ